MSPEVGPHVMRIMCVTGVHPLPLGLGMDIVRVLLSEKSPVRESVDNLSPKERDA